MAPVPRWCRGVELAVKSPGDVVLEGSANVPVGTTFLGAFGDVIPGLGSWTIRDMVMECRARLSRLSPPRSSRCRTVAPLEAGEGFIPPNGAKAASLRTPPGCDHAVRTVATVTAPVPLISSSGAAGFAGSAPSYASGHQLAVWLLRGRGAPTELLPRAGSTTRLARLVPSTWEPSRSRRGSSSDGPQPDVR